MVNILRVRTRWSGFTGAPGFTVLHFRDFGTGEGGGADPDQAQAQAAIVKVRDFFEDLTSLFPDEVQLAVDPVVDMLEDSTGELVDSFTGSAGANILGSSAASFPGPVGAVINWRTSAIRNGRRIRGRTFLVPLAGTAFGVGGGLTPTAQTTIQAAATALALNTGTPDLGVYARPTAPAATDGQWAVNNGANVPLLAAVLRSRRD